MGWEKCNLEDPNAQYPYCASGPPAVLFAALYLVVFCAQVVQAVLYRKKFCWVICMAAAWECGGFALRAYSTIDQTVNTVTTPATLLILLAPLWLNAFDYIIFGRMIYYYIPDRKIAGIKASYIATMFVLFDISAFIVQLVGGIMDSSTDLNTIKLGLNIYTVGVAIQQVFIFGFIGLIICFHRAAIKGQIFSGRPDYKKLLYPLYGTLLLITYRIIYRLVEFANGGNAEINGHEVYLYVFDAVPIMFAMIVWNLWHPGTILQGPDSEPPKKISKRKARSDAKRARWREERDAKKGGAAGKSFSPRSLTPDYDNSSYEMRSTSDLEAMPHMSQGGGPNQAASAAYGRNQQGYWERHG